MKVLSDLHLTADNRDGFILVLWAAFDTVNYSIHLHRHKNVVGLKGTVLQLLGSYLINRSFSVVIDYFLSKSTRLLLSHLGFFSQNMKQDARNLGVIFDVDLCFDTKVKNVVQSCFFSAQNDF